VSIVTTDFESWLETSRRILEHRVDDPGNIDISAFRVMFTQGFTPDQAVRERWMSDVQHCMVRFNVTPSEIRNLDRAFYFDLYDKGLTADQAVREDACLTR